jgi:hypothetical protein
LALVEQLLGTAQLADDLLGVVAFAFHGASPGQVWPIGKLSLGLDQFPGPTSHLLQQWFTLSDPLMEEMLIDTPCFRRFAGIETMEGRIPDETTILNFRHLLEEHRIAEQILDGVNQMLSERGVML